MVQPVTRKVLQAVRMNDFSHTSEQLSTLCFETEESPSENIINFNFWKHQTTSFPFPLPGIVLDCWLCN